MKTAIVGAGIVGSAIGFRLAGSGHDVTFFDPAAGKRSTSYGNAGHIGTASVVPWASPENLSSAFRNHADPTHPLTLRLVDLLGQPRWLARFLWACRRSSASQAMHALASILSVSDDWLNLLLKDANVEKLREKKGLLHVYLSEETARGARDALSRRRDMGIAVTDLRTDELFELEPGLIESASRSGVVGATLFPDVAQITSPQALLEAFRKGSMAGICAETVVDVTAGSAGVMIKTDLDEHAFDAVVIAAGLGSASLARPHGARVPLIAERGYHEQYDVPARFRRSALLVDMRVVASPMREGVRLTTGAEFTRSSRKPDFDRIAPVLDKAKPFLGIADNKPNLWSGDRPSTPDSMPVIGAAPSSNRVFLAYGHGHLGLTMAAVTAEIARAHFHNEMSPISLAPFRPDR
nr:FAD-dependent oxidoreductase [Hoeflea prorocentri]